MGQPGWGTLDRTHLTSGEGAGAEGAAGQRCARVVHSKRSLACGEPGAAPRLSTQGRTWDVCPRESSGLSTLR